MNGALLNSKSCQFSLITRFGRWLKLQSLCSVLPMDRNSPFPTDPPICSRSESRAVIFQNSATQCN